MGTAGTAGTEHFFGLLGVVGEVGFGRVWAMGGICRLWLDGVSVIWSPLVGLNGSILRSALKFLHAQNISNSYYGLKWNAEGLNPSLHAYVFLTICYSKCSLCYDPGRILAIATLIHSYSTFLI